MCERLYDVVRVSSFHYDQLSCAPLLLRASQILYDPIKATLPRAPFSFLMLRIPTWLQMNSRLAAFLNNDRVGCYSL